MAFRDDVKQKSFNDMVKSVRCGVSKTDSSKFLFPLMFDYPRTFVVDSEAYGRCVFELDADSFICATYRCGAWEFTVMVETDISPSYAERYGGINYELYNTETREFNHEISSMIMRDDDKSLISSLPIIFSEVAGRLMNGIYISKSVRRGESVMKSHDFQVGDILVSSWGYDQTNVDFYQVVGVTASSVRIRQIKTDIIDVGAMAMSGNAIPVPDVFVNNLWFGEQKTARVQQGYYGDSIKITHDIYAQKWSGKPEYVSWYA